MCDSVYMTIPFNFLILTRTSLLIQFIYQYSYIEAGICLFVYFPWNSFSPIGSLCHCTSRLLFPIIRSAVIKLHHLPYTLVQISYLWFLLFPLKLSLINVYINSKFSHNTILLYLQFLPVLSGRRWELFPSRWLK